MSFLDKLEKFWRPYAVPGVTLHLIGGQLLCYAVSLSYEEFLGKIVLVPVLVFKGEVWRLLTFLFFPPLAHPIFMFFAWYLFYLMGDALEQQWGVSRYNIFLMIAYFATLLASLLTPYSASTNVFIGGSVFLAFAYLFPDFQLLLMFILPVKVKWFAWLTWLTYFWILATGPWAAKLLVAASVSNFLLFFGRDIYLGLRARRHRLAREVQHAKQQHEVVHRCVVCGVTDKTDPGMDFRYCSKCEGALCYCQDHIRNHQHRTAVEEAEEAG